MSYYIGLMSGTSMDGIDVAILEPISQRLIAGQTYRYSSEVQALLLASSQSNQVRIADLLRLNTLLGQAFAQSVLAILSDSGISKQQIAAIGSHGQTICHDTSGTVPYTLQLGCAHTIAELTGLPVVADFRTRDLVVGGQGAPFAPLYHQVLFARETLPLAVVNIGGIANVSFLSKNVLAGYDTGPGNCLLDFWIQQQLGHPYDQAGEWAASGQVNEELLASFLSDPYFQMAAPKSLGKEYFSLAWLAPHLQQVFGISSQWLLETATAKHPVIDDAMARDVQATLVALTVVSIRQAVLSAPELIHRVMLCGGGAHNKTLVAELQRQLPACVVKSTEAIGISPDFIEAMMFAWLAEKTMQQTPVALGAITGAKKPAILGAIYAPGIDKSNSYKV